MQYLENLGVKHETFCITEFDPQMLFLPHSHKVGNDDKVFEENNFDTIIVFDSGDLKYAGIENLISSLEKPPVLINFDHHNTNNNFGHYNYVMRGASATTEVLFNFYKHIEHTLDNNHATCLLTGLVTDTGNFSNQGTTNSSLMVAAELVRSGAQYDQILKKTMNNKSIRALKLWGLLLSRLTLNKKHDISFTYITRDDIDETGASEKDIEGLANFLNNLGEGKAVVVFRERADGSVKGSMRTTRNDVDVSEIAMSLGGGGHKKSAGFAIENAMINNADDAWALIEPAFESGTGTDVGTKSGTEA